MSKRTGKKPQAIVKKQASFAGSSYVPKIYANITRDVMLLGDTKEFDLVIQIGNLNHIMRITKNG